MEKKRVTTKGILERIGIASIFLGFVSMFIAMPFIGTQFGYAMIAIGITLLGLAMMGALLHICYQLWKFTE